MPNRIIKESICTSDEIDALTPSSEVLFYRLMVNADDYGRFDARLKLISSKCYPLKSIDIKSIHGDLSKLQAVGLVSLYEVDGKPYLQIVNWAKHQQIRAQRAKFPGEEDGVAISCNQLISDVHVIQSNPIQSESNPNPVTPRQSSIPSTTELLPAVAKAPAPNTSETEVQSRCRETWANYSAAYAGRYGTDPVRNAKVNTQVKQLVQRIGSEAPDVAGWFVAHPGGFYVQRMHDFGALLADAEKLRTEWATGRVMTSTAAKQSDRRGAMASAVSNLLAECGGNA